MSLIDLFLAVDVTVDVLVLVDVVGLYRAAQNITSGSPVKWLP